VHEEEEDLGESLAQQLILYRQIKQQAQWLNTRINANLRSYVHVPLSFTSTVKADLTGLGLQDLAEALENLLSAQTLADTSSLLSIPKLTLKQKVQEILTLLLKTDHVTFQALVGEDHSRLNIIVVFLAILELVKQIW